MPRLGDGRQGGILNKLLVPIGMGAEAVAHHQEKKKAKKAEEKSLQADSQTSTAVLTPSASTASVPNIQHSLAAGTPPPYIQRDQYPTDQQGLQAYPVDEKQSCAYQADGKLANQFGELDIEDEALTPNSLEDAEHDWQLDEAGEEVNANENKDVTSSPKSALSSENFKKGWARQADIDSLVKTIIAFHSITPIQGPSQLSCPVIIPQRRPGAKDRGFVKAYAPVMETCGISERAFLDFLVGFDKSLELSPYIGLLELASGIVGMVPGMITLAVSTAVNVSIQVAKATAGHYRQNSYIAKMNVDFFMPQGMICMIMKYKPNKRNASHASTVIDNSLGKAMKPWNKWDLRTTKGSTGEIELPPSAPLVFPALENASEESKKANWYKRSMAFRTDYKDKRAIARFQGDNPNSALSASAEKPTFASKLADPNQTKSLRDVVSHSISGITGGNNQDSTGQGPVGHYDRSYDEQHDQGYGGRRHGGSGRHGRERSHGRRGLIGGAIGLASGAISGAMGRDQGRPGNGHANYSGPPTPYSGEGQESGYAGAEGTSTYSNHAGYGGPAPYGQTSQQGYVMGDSHSSDPHMQQNTNYGYDQPQYPMSGREEEHIHDGERRGYNRGGRRSRRNNRSFLGVQGVAGPIGLVRKVVKEVGRAPPQHNIGTGIPLTCVHRMSYTCVSCPYLVMLSSERRRNTPL